MTYGGRFVSRGSEDLHFEDKTRQQPKREHVRSIQKGHLISFL